MPDLEERITACEHWAAAHDGRINAYWEGQFKWNKEMKIEMRAMGSRVTALERRVVYFAGAAAALGAFLSGGVPTVLKLFTGG